MRSQIQSSSWQRTHNQPPAQDDNSGKRRSTDQDKGNNKHRKLDEDEDSFVEYKDFARWIIRSEHLLVSWYTVLDVGLKVDAEDYEDYDWFTKQYAIELNIYHRLHKKYQRFAQDIKKMKRNSTYEKKLVSLLRSASRGARSDDSNSLMVDGLEYINAKYGPLDPPISSKRQKADVRGFNHPTLARLLCPIDYLESFDRDPKGFCDKLLNGSVKIHSTDFPLCLYDEGLIDKEDPSVGLMQSKILVVFFKHIFIGPSTALKDGPGGSKAKRGQAQKNNMKKATAGSIAYAATQLRWCLSASDDWRLGDGNWDPELFYAAIMQAFGINVLSDKNEGEEEEDDDDDEASEWAKDTISWFTTQVFVDKPAAESTEPIRGSTLDTLLAKRRVQRAARRAAAGTLQGPRQTTSSPGPMQTTNTRSIRQTASSPIRSKTHENDSLTDSETEEETQEGW